MATSNCLHCLACPICDAALTQNGGTFRCANGHTFDRAKEGYVNFLAATGRAPKITGDTREMLIARRAFLDRGHYQALSDAVDAVVVHYLRDRESGGSACLLDAGCGEGYYLGRLRTALESALPDRPVCYFGSDVSRDAARLAAKRNPGVLAVVANTHEKLPFASIDVLLDIFAPRGPTEFYRITAPGALLVVVIPSPRHLQEARRKLKLLGIQEEKRSIVVEQLAGRFDLVDEIPVEQTLQLDATALRQLVQMSPSNWHLSEPERARLDRSGPMTVTASFEVLTFVRSD